MHMKLNTERFTRYLTVILFGSMLTVLASCALPRPPVMTAEQESAQIATDYARQGLDYFSHGRFFEAERSFRLAIKSSSRSPTLAFNLALSLERQGSLFEASDILQTLTEQYPREPLYWAARARVAAAKGELVPSLDFYDRALAAAKSVNIANTLNVNFAGENFDVRGLLIAKAGIASTVGRIDEAICASEDAYLLAPTPADLDRYIRTLLGFGRLQQAFERSTRAIRTKEVPVPSTDLMRALIFYFVENNRCDDAVRWLERAGRTGAPDGATALDFDLSLLVCGRDPRFYTEFSSGAEADKQLIAQQLKERRNGKTPFGYGWPASILKYALDLSETAE